MKITFDRLRFHKGETKDKNNQPVKLEDIVLCPTSNMNGYYYKGDYYKIGVISRILDIYNQVSVHPLKEGASIKVKNFYKFKSQDIKILNKLHHNEITKFNKIESYLKSDVHNIQKAIEIVKNAQFSTYMHDDMKYKEKEGMINNLTKNLRKQQLDKLF